MENVLVLYQTLFPHSNVFPGTTGTWDSWETPPGILSTRSLSDNTCLFIELRAWFLGHTGIPTIIFFFLIWWWVISCFILYAYILLVTLSLPHPAYLCSQHCDSLLCSSRCDFPHICITSFMLALPCCTCTSSTRLVWISPSLLVSLYVIPVLFSTCKSCVSGFLVVCLSLNLWFVLLLILWFFEMSSLFLVLHWF